MPQDHSKTQRIFIVVATLAFVAYLAAQHRLVFPYHDDWGYAVLSYTTEQTGFVGRNFDLSNLANFLAEEYKNWSGRVAAFMLQISLFKMGLDYVRVYQVTTILGILAFSLLISLNRQPTALLITLPMLLYLALPESALVGGIYWFSAAAGYMWGLPFIFSAAYLIKINNELGFAPALLLAASAMFHELMAVISTSFAFILVAFFYFKFNKTGVARHLFFLSAPLFAALVTVLAPGNFRRKSVSTYPHGDGLDLVFSNAASIADFTLKGGALFSFSLLVAFFILLLGINSPDKSYRKPIAIYALTAIAAVLFLAGDRYLFAAFALGLGLLGAVLFNACKNDLTGALVFSLFLASCSSLGLLLLAPGVPGRALIPFYFLLFPTIVFSFSRADGYVRRWLATSAAGVILLFGTQNAYRVYSGYSSNFDVNYINLSKLETLSFDIKNGDRAASSIELYKLPNPRFAEAMPYERALIETWIKKYYELPPEIEFTWREVQL